MKLIIAGGRHFCGYKKAEEFLNETYKDYTGKVEVVCGMAKDADEVGRQIALTSKMKVHEFPAEWDKYGKSAGYKRNVVMANFADELVAFWDGKSKGTQHMIDIMQALNKPVHICYY